MIAVEFYKLVQEMRDAQKAYFRTRLPEVLQRSKKLEAQVDKEIAELNKPDKVQQKHTLLTVWRYGQLGD